MFCSNCGKENLEDSAFCYDCGSPLKNNEANVEPVKKIEFGEIKNQNEIKCPFCGNNNVERVNRIGCLGCLGETVLGVLGIFLIMFILGLVIEALPIQGDTDGIYDWVFKACWVCFILGLIFNIFSVIVNWTKPKWTWDMECKDCQKKFVWDTSVKRVVKK